jgi:hypothetical protein
MRKVFTTVFVLGLLLPMLLLQTPGMSTLQFDADLSFTPETGKRFHMWMFTVLIGFETRWANRNFIAGAINTLYDEVIEGSGNGIVNGKIEFTVYEALDFSNTLEGEQGPPGSGGGGMRPGSSLDGPGPVDLVDGHLVYTGAGFGGGDEPKQGAYDPGSGGSGGGGGNTKPNESFYLTPIFENNIGYTISSSGRLLDVTGLETIGDIVDPTYRAEGEDILDPARQISVRQIFQVGHFLVLPDYTVHIGESWRAPFWWDIPLIGKPVKIPITFELRDIRTYYRFRCAEIDFTGLTDIDMNLLDENYTRRRESHVKGDIVINGSMFFDLDRGVVVAVKNPFRFGGTMYNQFINLNLGRFFTMDWGFMAMLNFDRIDLITPLGNVLDKRTEKDHVLQEFVWRSDIQME